MNTALRKRITDVKEYLDDKLLKEVPRRCWQIKGNEYIPTRNIVGGKNYFPQQQEETIVKYDFKRALISGALFFIFNFLMFLFIVGKAEAFPASFWLMHVVLLVALFFPLLNGKKRGSLIVFNKDGFQVETMPLPVSWEYLTASFIRVDDCREDRSYFLLLFYYDETKDEFQETAYSLEGLDMRMEQIAAQIEYWKMIVGTNAIIV